MDSAALPELWSQTHADGAALETLPPERSYSFGPPPAADPRADSCLDFAGRTLIGRGGMGEVFAVRQPQLERTLAVKTLRADREDSDSLAAFMAEAVVTGQLEHPNIVPVHALGQHDDSFYIAMQKVAGQTWREALRERPDDLAAHLETLIQVGNALAYAHSQGIVHNDLKPANVMLGRFGEVYLLDWGLATRVGPRVPGSRVRHAHDLGGPGGTPAYFPPELATGNGSAIGPWTDVYLLGASLHDVLCGRPPHGTTSVAASLLQMAAGSSWLFPEHTPAELARLCRDALAFHPEQRLQSAAEFVTALRGFLRHRESLQLTASARELLSAARAADNPTSATLPGQAPYQSFAESVARFRQAHALWQENQEAQDGERDARQAYARSALRRGDLGLAEAQVAHLEDAELQAAVTRARREQARAQRLRQRLQAALFLCLALILSGLGAGAFTLYLKNQTIAEQLAQLELEKSNAQTRGGIAENALRRLSNEVQHTLLDKLGSAEAHASARTILGVAVDGWRELRDADYAHSRVQRGTASAHLELAWLHARLDGSLPEGLREFAAAVRVLRADRSAEGQLLLGSALRGAAWCHDMLEQLGESDDCLTEAVALLRVLRAARPDAPGPPAELAQCLLVQARLRTKQGALESAAASASEACELLEAQGPSAQPALAMAWALSAGVSLQQGRTAEALRRSERSLELRRAAFGEDSLALQTRRDLASGLILSGNIWLAAGDETASLRAYQEAQRLLAALVELDATQVQDLENLAVGLLQAAKSQSAERPGLALRGGQQALQLFRRLLRAQSSHQGWRRKLADCLRLVGRLHLQRFEETEALALLHEARQLAGALAAEHRHPEARLEHAESCFQLARACWLSERPDRAWRELSAALDIYEQISTDTSSVAVRYGQGTALTCASGLLVELQRDEEALSLAERGLALWSELVASDPDNPHVRSGQQRAQAELAVLLAKTGDAERAREVAAPLWDIARQPAAPGSEDVHAYVQAQVRRTLELLGETAAAGLVAGWQRAQLEQRSAASPEHIQLQKEWIMACVAEAGLLQARDPARARVLFSQALQRARELAAANTHPARLLLCRVLSAASRRGILQGEAQVERLQELWIAAESLLQDSPDNLELLQIGAQTTSDLGSWLLRHEQELGAAREFYEQSLALRERIAAARPNSFAGRQGLAFGWNALGDLCKAEGDLEEASAYYRDSLAIRQALLDEEPDDPERLRNLSVGLGRLGLLLLSMGKLAEADAALQQLLDTRARMFAADTGDPEAAMDYAVALSFAAQLELQRGQAAKALRLLAEAEEHGGWAAARSEALEAKLRSILQLQAEARRQLED